MPQAHGFGRAGSRLHEVGRLAIVQGRSLEPRMATLSICQARSSLLLLQQFGINLGKIVLNLVCLTHRRIARS